ncbi:hypothetical protein FHS83_003186 [Rhizomicrobium palustre]|uniref:Uncharacterized protein n=1 Tax=Rhizomicrobium palustre TaxID=189966 RepID=A0A846N1P3_9PROT|nr:hypothetical protein [Rhizomicrobium palustre]NIK89868.1 hypothetical protein [Rhizomicrobium palustre]
MSAVGKPKIVLLGQKDPNSKVELTADEGPFESWLAVAQDMWGLANLTPVDGIFASRAIGTIVPTQGGNFGCLTYHLGSRLFTFSREGGIWIDAFEAEPTISKMEKRPKDKVKLATWAPGKNLLAGKKMTHLAILSPSLMPGTVAQLIEEAAPAVKKDGQVFLADIMCAPSGRTMPLWKHKPAEYKDWLEKAGLKFYSEIDLTDDVRVSLLRGLHNSLNMLANVRKLSEPWKGQRLRAFEKELEMIVTLHTAIERGWAVATGLYYTKA